MHAVSVKIVKIRICKFSDLPSAAVEEQSKKIESIEKADGNPTIPLLIHQLEVLEKSRTILRQFYGHFHLGLRDYVHESEDLAWKRQATRDL